MIFLHEKAPVKTEFRILSVFAGVIISLPNEAMDVLYTSKSYVSVNFIYSAATIFPATADAAAVFGDPR